MKEALAQPEQERCVGCEACIDTACGRDECPKGWPKAAQPEQEPVAQKIWEEGAYGPEITELRDIPVGAFLYTTPPQRAWVGLTDEEIDDIWRTHLHRDSRVQAIEAKLKEKNT